MTNRAQITRQSESHDSTPPASKGSDSIRHRSLLEKAVPGVRRSPGSRAVTGGTQARAKSDPEFDFLHM